MHVPPLIATHPNFYVLTMVAPSTQDTLVTAPNSFGYWIGAVILPLPPCPRKKFDSKMLSKQNLASLNFTGIQMSDSILGMFREQFDDTLESRIFLANNFTKLGKTIS